MDEGDDTGGEHFLSPKLEGRSCGSRGHGLFAARRIHAGELLVVWGGSVVRRGEFTRLPKRVQVLSLQIEEELFMVNARTHPADFVNHSCEPNAGLAGQIALVAMRDIEVSEEICFDYAMSDGSDYDSFECACRSPRCRERVSGSDWRRPELQQRYRGYFSPYLQRRIDAVGERPGS